MVVNYTGGDTWVPSLKVLKVGGRLLTCGATAGYAPAEDIRFIWTFELKVLGSNGWMRSDIETLLKMAQEKKLKELVDKILAQAREQARGIVDQANSRATSIVDQARTDGETERKRQVEAARAGDAGRGQSLIVWAIAEGRSAAAHVDAYLSGATTLPIAVEPTTRSLV